MQKYLFHWFPEEQGQDLVEYSLLIALVVLLSAGLMNQSGSSVSGIWTATSTALTGGAFNAGVSNTSQPVHQYDQ